MIRYISHIFIAVILFCLCSCGQNCYGVDVDTTLFLEVQDEQGNNLLNSKYFSDSIKIYYTSYDGCVIYYYNKTVECVDSTNQFAFKGFVIEYNRFVLNLRGAASHEHGEEHFFNPWNMDNTIYIEWNSQETDTIFVTFVRLESPKDKDIGACKVDAYDKVYYNGKLIVSSWKDNIEKMSQGVYPVIIK